MQVKQGKADVVYNNITFFPIYFINVYRKHRKILYCNQYEITQVKCDANFTEI